MKLCGNMSCAGFSLIIVLLFALASPPGAWAWTEHPLVISETLSSLPLVRDAKPVKAESLEAFLSAEEKGLVTLLGNEETWARKNLAWYRPLPDSLAFRATGNGNDLRQRFCHAIRINPDSRLGLYLQLVPGQDAQGRPAVAPDGLTFLKDITEWKMTRFTGLGEGEVVTPLEVVQTASDEPDFGLDIGLYEDNGTPFGRIYGFGKQPFGNPNLEYSSQGPFHMGYYHEAGIVDLFAPFIKQTYPEERIHLYKSLATYAFSTGHDYWGWRFMGIGLHYIMDLTLPYHTTLLPGVSTPRMLWINFLDMVGRTKPEEDAIQLVSNRHTAMEKFQQMAMLEAFGKGDRNYPVFVALGTVGTCPPWDDRMPRDVISARSHALAGKADRAMAETMPDKWVSDPSFELGTSPEQDEVLAVMRRKSGDAGVAQATDLLKEMMEPLPAYTCSYMNSILAK